MKLDIRRIQLTCLIRGCTNVEDGMPLDRHHVRSQKMWVTAFAWHSNVPRLRARYLRFKERYEQFRESDIQRICREHHEEAHDMYYQIVEDLKRKHGPYLGSYTWAQAEQVMQTLERHFYQWLKRKNKRNNASFFRTLRPKR